MYLSIATYLPTYALLDDMVCVVYLCLSDVLVCQLLSVYHLWVLVLLLSPLCCPYVSCAYPMHAVEPVYACVV